MQRTYVGFAPKGEVGIPATYVLDDDGNPTTEEATPARVVAFERGRPVDFEAHEVDLLSDEWVTPGSKDAKAAAAGKPVTIDPPTEGNDEEASDG